MPRTLLIVILSLGAAGCAGPRLFGNYPVRSADLYPQTQTVSDVAFAVDAVTSDERARRFFGARLLSQERILPVALIITNHGQHRLLVHPGDVMLHHSDTVIDPLPPRLVAGIASGAGGAADPDSAFGRYFNGLAFKETEVGPGESYHGIMFFALPESAMGSGGYNQVPVFATGGLQLAAQVRDLQTHSRLRFGPFSLSMPYREGR